MKILTGILIFMMMLTGSFTEIQAYDVSWVTDPSNDFSMTSSDVNMRYSLTSSGTKSFYLNYTFQQFTNGMAIWNYDGDASLDNGGLPNGFYTIESAVNARYQHLYIGSLHFKVYQYDYEFQITHNPNDTFTLAWVGSGTNDPRYSTSSIVYNYAQGSETHWISVYDSLYSVLLTYDQGREDGFIDGYEQARSEYGIYDSSNDTWIDAASWGVTAYQEGLGMSDSGVLSLQNMIPGVLGVFIAFFFQVMSISVLGVSILDLIALMFGVAVVLLLFKTFVK